MTTVLTRRAALSGALAATGAAALAAPALAQGALEWTMVTSWPKNLPGPGVSARRVAEGVAEASGGRLTVKLFAAGELVPGLEVFDAVARGTAEIGHTASLFWAGKTAAAPFFTAAPFGLSPLEHIAWIDHGGGQQLWDRLYEPFGLKPFMGGNTGFQMGGWFKRAPASLADIRGLRIRMPGLGGEVMRRLGATPVSIAPGEIVAALQAGTIDAAEFLGPWSDAASGFFQAAPVYVWPGWHEPNGTGEALISLQAWSVLPGDLQAIVSRVLAAENIRGLGEAEWNNAAALHQLVVDKGVRLSPYPPDVLAAARRAADEVFDEMIAEGGIEAEIVTSYREARMRFQPWSKISQAALLAARE